jgi:hypothetical protein
MKSYSWTKLLLDKDSRLSQHNRQDIVPLWKSDGNGFMTLPHGKTATDVVADFLSEVYKYVSKELAKRLSPQVLAITPLEFWFTVPAIWSDQAKDATKQAARKAGFGERARDSFYMIPEPEAAAVATLKSLTLTGTEGQIYPGDGVLICDCGGGTVDITTYQITSVSPTLEFEEMLVGTGGKFGSTYIDREFLKWMSNTFGSAFYERVPFEKKGPGSRFMRDFEWAKRGFAGPTAYLHDYECTLAIPGASDSVHYDTEEHRVKFARSVQFHQHGRRILAQECCRILMFMCIHVVHKCWSFSSPSLRV